MVQAVEWKDPHLRLIDQRRLPGEEIYLMLSTIEDAHEAIKQLVVRGAPAIGITAAYGLYLGMRNSGALNRSAYFDELEQRISFLSTARPTAVNLFWALAEMKRKLTAMASRDTVLLNAGLLDMARELHEDDRLRCEAIGDHGLGIIPDKARVMTHCNTGALATGGIGTALGVIYRAHQRGKDIEVYANETRPVLQGARLTVWELKQAGIPANLICDNMAAAMMQRIKADVVIVGADRIAADGSVANKIGTYSLAILARFHEVPFYVAAPLSTFDLAAHSGADIPIETRESDEIRKILNQTLITVADIPCWSPAFDVTPPELITGIITEKGIIRRPNREKIAKMFATNS